MDEHDHEVATADAAAPPSPKIAATGKHAKYLNRRNQRLDDLTAEALEEPDALRATVKNVIAQLFDIGYRMGDDVKASIGSGQAKPKARQDVAAGINALMLVHRQITRYVQLDQQWVSERTSTNEAGMPSVEVDGGG
jgi:hypothetical protein